VSTSRPSCSGNGAGQSMQAALCQGLMGVSHGADGWKAPEPWMEGGTEGERGQGWVLHVDVRVITQTGGRVGGSVDASVEDCCSL
jgi:hypothetical protein